MSTGRTLVLRFSLPNTIRPVDVLDWIAQMLATHSGAKVSIEPAQLIEGRQSFAVISAEIDNADTVRLAWRDNQSDWRGTGAELCA